MRKSTEPIEQIRARICAERKALAAASAATAATAACRNLAQLPELSGSTRIATYLAVNGEIETIPFIRDAWQRNKRVYLPVLQTGNTLLFAPYTSRSRMRNNRYHIAEPEITADEPPLPAAAMDILIIPLVAFDRNCHRIGMGAGFYDRTLAGGGPSAPVRIGLAYELQQVAPIQPRDWDIPMHKIVTESRIYSRPA
jgi:5-formyltetrahydrofolate cyclo-ligase